MSHELENTNGVTFYADARSDAWHQLGQQVGHTMDAGEAMTQSHLAGWNVRKVPISIPQEPILTESGVTSVPPITIPDRFATVRTNPLTGVTEYLGVVGNKYEPVQNEASTDLLQLLTDESGAVFETAGALYGGRQTFLTMKLPHTMSIVGSSGVTDTTEWYLAALNSHDGSTAWRAILTPVRIVCANTQAWALKSAKSSFSIRHTRNAKANIAEARRVLGIAWESIGVLEEEFQKLVEVPCSVAEAKVYADKLADVEAADSKRSVTMRQNAASGILKLFVSSPTVAPIAGTRYGFYNAVTEYSDHYAPVRGSNGDDATARALRTIRDQESSTSLKAQAFAMMRADLATV